MNSSHQPSVIVERGAIVIMVRYGLNQVDGVGYRTGVIVLAIASYVEHTDHTIHFGNIEFSVRTELQGCAACNDLPCIERAE